MLAAIPYTTFPRIDVGPLQVRTFGVMVALGVVVGAAIAARLGERWGVSSDDTISLATRLVVAGVVGARLTWVVTHVDQIDNPLDVIAVWEGGLQFSGGFIAAVLVAFPIFRRWDRVTRWRMVDALALGLAVGLAFGRVGCYAVGEHFGGRTGFPLATRYEGGATREGPITPGTVIHQTALYELVFLLVLAAVLWWLIVRRDAPAATAIGVFCLWYGVCRFTTDFLRAYDDTVLGLTGAQWMCVALVPAAAWLLGRVRPSVAAAGQAGEASV